jgi:hypothetical protein
LKPYRATRRRHCLDEIARGARRRHAGPRELIAAHAALSRTRDPAAIPRAKLDVEAAIEGVLVEAAEKIADQISERMEEINGLRALIGVRGGFVSSLATVKTMRLRGLIAANDTTTLSRPETPMGQAAIAANDCWCAFTAALATDARGGLAI